MLDFTGFTAEIFSGVAVLLSAYTLWQTSLKRADLKVFVPPLIRYASPYQNSIFEVFEIPLTIVNDGARTGTVLSLNLEVTTAKGTAAKQFYSAGAGPWSLTKAKGLDLQPFMPLSIAGRASRSETILFYPRSDTRVQQIAEAEGRYRFVLTLAAANGDKSYFSRARVDALTFEMDLPFIDHRAFTGGSGTLTLNHPDWQASAR